MRIVSCYEGEENRSSEEEEERILIPMERMSADSAREMAEKTRLLVGELGEALAPELVRKKEENGPQGAAEEARLLYWDLPQILRRGIEEGHPGIRLQNYDLPLLDGLEGGFGRYSTELVSAIAEACAEACGQEGELCLTRELPFPLYRIGLPDSGGEPLRDGRRKERVQTILCQSYRQRYREQGERWLRRLERDGKRPGVRLSSEEVTTPGQWLALAQYTGTDRDLEQQLRDLRIDAVSIR